ncbi:MAG TPA: non-homologous end-joining DNA ligase [Kofleriaceae bacterium]|jgi:bifunctional non-homologous end joining protein LigD
MSGTLAESIPVDVTHPERVVFPSSDSSAGITKGDIVAYYALVADAVLPEVIDRPLTLERYTKSIVEGGFYQKHAQKHYPAFVERVTLGGKTKVTYPVVTDRESLLYLVNQGGFVLHIWSSRRATPMQPDALIFDLDPPEGRFDLAREVAVKTKALLDEMQLPAFIKTTGSKGLHVVVPLDGKDDYGDAGQLISALAKILVQRHPDLVTLEFYKKDRGGRLYLDLGRTAPGATFVAPYSLRGRPGAPVSAPIEWSELATVTPDGITLRDVPHRLERGDPWAALRANPANATDVLRALLR